MTVPNHLIIVCGHAIWLGGPENGYDESEWLIESYKKGETPTFIAHIKDGVRALSEDVRAVLVFSGGPTRRETQLSEGESYRNLARANAYFDLLPRADRMPDPTSTSRVLVEGRALDSYYNILFSLVLFWKAHGVWPEHLTIVSHEFKRKRLVDLHCTAIGFPLDRITFLGTNPPGLDWQSSSALDGAQASEEQRKIVRSILEAEDQWAADPHGADETLASKRRKRNVWAVDQKLFVDDAERKRSGLETRLLGDGTETLVEGSSRPWLPGI